MHSAATSENLPAKTTCSSSFSVMLHTCLPVVLTNATTLPVLSEAVTLHIVLGFFEKGGQKSRFEKWLKIFKHKFKSHFEGSTKHIQTLHPAIH